ncbi:hypothetical protein MLD38_016088 [Melastoma candidum]|uniref:Uncharacterized protein n=1 Tax=Melastoma candidum TaxID=119954 RepID=A0ACB9RLY1_9MYRT|nr:hypothetical protein MLD38_016088 [Melastoma candidum]
MARHKVQLRYMADAAARKASLKKRRQGLLKKVQELTVLCDVQACAIVYGEDRTEPPVHWPEDRGKVDMVLRRFRSCTEMDQRKKMVSKDEYVRQKTEKYKEQVRRLRGSVHEMEMLHLIQLIHIDGRPHSEFTTGELRRLDGFTREKLRELERKADVLAKAGNAAASDPPPPCRDRGVSPQNPQAAPSALAGDFQGIVDGLRRRTTPLGGNVLEQIPYSRRREGSTMRFSARNFEVGGSSGTANEWVGDRGAFLGHDTLIPEETRPGIVGGIRNHPRLALSAAFPCTTGNISGLAAYPYEWSDIGGLVPNIEPVGPIDKDYINIGPYIGQPQPGPGSNMGQFGSIDDIVRGNINAGDYSAKPHGYVSSIPSWQNPMLGGNTDIHGGFGFDIEAPLQNIPRAIMGSSDPASLAPDVRKRDFDR